MIGHRTRAEVRRFDIIKLLILGVLVVVFVLTFLRSGTSEQDRSGDAVPTFETVGEADPVSALSAKPASLTAPRAGEELLAGDVQFSGIGDPGTRVEILRGGAVIASTLVGDDGSWAVSGLLNEGDANIRLRTRNAGGDEIGTSDPFAVTVLKPAPEIAAPSLITTIPADLKAPGTVQLEGKGTPGSLVEIVLNGEVVDTVEVGPDGSWIYDLALDRSGEYDLQLRALDNTGKFQAEMAPVSFSAAAAAAVPTVELPERMAVGTIVPFSGTGEPGSVVEILIDGVVVGTATVGEDGSWMYPYALTSVGDFELGIRTLDAGGKVVNETDPISINILEPTAPELTFPAGGSSVEDGAINLEGTGEPSTFVEISVNGEVVGNVPVSEDGTWTYPISLDKAGDYEIGMVVLSESGDAVLPGTTASISLVEPSGAVGAAPGLISPKAGESLSGEIVFEGNGSPGTAIEILQDGEVLGTATVGDDGSWRFPFTPEPGDHAYAVRPAGDATLTSDPVQVSVSSSQAETGSGSTGGSDAGEAGGSTGSGDSSGVVCAFGQDKGKYWEVGRCDTLYYISNVTGIPFTNILEANPEITEPNLIFPGQRVKLPGR